MKYSPPVPTKEWAGMHLGNRNTGNPSQDDWSLAMLAPFDPAQGQGGTWPQIVVVLSDQVFNVENRGANCKITQFTIEKRNNNIYSYLKRAALSGRTAVIIRIYPSPGNFQESILEEWTPDESSRPNGRTLIITAGVRPGNWSQCGNTWRFRPIDDVADEMLAIQRYALNDGWQVYGFEPANEPNIEWYYNRARTECTDPCYTVTDPWAPMDDYFANLYDYVQNNKGSTPIRVFSPPMAMRAQAEDADVLSDLTPCASYPFNGYGLMYRTFNSGNPKNNGYSWHNYFIQAREGWGDCPYGMHVAYWFPSEMAYTIMSGQRDAFITEADLAPSQKADWHNPISDKDQSNGVAAANALRDFLDYERNASSGAGARRIAVWLLSDNTGNEEHVWAQAWDGTVFRQWFGRWWYSQEPHIP